MARPNTAKQKIHEWLDKNPKGWLTANKADVARQTGLSRKSVNAYLTVCVAEREGGLPSEYDQMRRDADPVVQKRIALRAKVRDLCEKDTPISDIIFHTGASYDTIMKIVREDGNNDDNPEPQEEDALFR